MRSPRERRYAAQLAPYGARRYERCSALTDVENDRRCQKRLLGFAVPRPRCSYM
jgi:hypothetical protein